MIDDEAQTDPFDQFSVAEGQFSKAAESALFKGLVELASQVSRSMSSRDIASIEAAKTAALALVRKHFDNMQHCATQRRQNLLDPRQLNVVSLGYDCFPRTLMSRWGIKKTARMGEMSMPFDLAIHPSGAVAHLLETDFANYFDGSWTFDRNKNFPIHRELGIEFNHEKGEQFSADGMAEFTDRYRKRVDNFQQILEDETRAAFVYHAETPDFGSLERIFRNIRKRRGNRPTEYVVLHTPLFGHAPDDLNTIAETGVTIVSQPYPFKGYVWWNKAHTYSKRGFAFERQLAEKLALALG